MFAELGAMFRQIRNRRNNGRILEFHRTHPDLQNTEILLR